MQLKNYLEYIRENIQQARKNFPNMSDEDLNEINQRLKNKHYVNLVAKIYNDNNRSRPIYYIVDEVEKYLNSKNYLTLDLESNYLSLSEFIDRNKLYSQMESLPKNFKRNNQDIRSSYSAVKDELSYMMSLYSMTTNKSDTTRKKIDSIVSASNKSLNDIINLLEDKYTLDEFDEQISKDIFSDIEASSEGLIYENDVWTNDEKTKFVVTIDSLEAMQFIGKTTSWCHSYKDAHMNYATYTYYGKTRVLIDFTDNSVENMCVLTNKFYEAFDDDRFSDWIEEYQDGEEQDLIDEEMIFNRHNEPLASPFSYLFHFFGDLGMEEIEKILGLV